MFLTKQLIIFKEFNPKIISLLIKDMRYLKIKNMINSELLVSHYSTLINILTKCLNEFNIYHGDNIKNMTKYPMWNVECNADLGGFLIYNIILMQQLYYDIENIDGVIRCQKLFDIIDVVDNYKNK